MQQTKRGSFLQGEELFARVPLIEWIEKNMQNDSEDTALAFLHKNGKVFDHFWSNYPSGVIRPAETQYLMCHSNNILYAYLLDEVYAGDTDDFRFITGVYGMKAKNENVPADKKYFISPHSFLTYRGKVLDCSIFNHPPKCYVPDQYFGVSFLLRTVIEMSEAVIDSGVRCLLNPLVLLQEKPYDP